MLSGWRATIPLLTATIVPPRNHPFVDGNNRTAAVVSETFLMLNSYGLAASDAELVVTFIALAAGELSENELAAWLREHVVLA